MRNRVPAQSVEHLHQLAARKQLGRPFADVEHTRVLSCAGALDVLRSESLDQMLGLRGGNRLSPDHVAPEQLWDVSRVPWKSRGVASVGLVYLV